MTQEEEGKQQNTEISRSTSNAELFAKLNEKSDDKFDNNLNKNVGMLVRITPRMINYWATVRFCKNKRKSEKHICFVFQNIFSLIVISVCFPGTEADLSTRARK